MPDLQSLVLCFSNIKLYTYNKVMSTEFFRNFYVFKDETGREHPGERGFVNPGPPAARVPVQSALPCRIRRSVNRAVPGRQAVFGAGEGSPPLKIRKKA
jgi:hypothetical protein